MALTAPTYAGTYSQSECNTNAATMTAFVDTANTAITTNKTALSAAMDALIKSARITHGSLPILAALRAQQAALVASP